MIRAAGVLFLATDGLALFLKRGAGSDHPGEWCCPGGVIEEGESAIQAAVRESDEECGRAPKQADLQEHCRTLAPAQPMPIQVTPGDDLTTEAGEPITTASEECDFTTFVCRVDTPFTPVLCEEHSGYAWASIDAPPLPLHPGMQVALDRLNMDELALAKAIAAGQLMSPQVYGRVTLFALRVTGTGLSYRDKLDEHVWRDPSLYLNDEFLERCQGLPVIMQHSPGALDSKEFAKRIVGTVMLPYIKGDEVWAVARIYDDAAVKMLRDLKLSTSPMVVLGVDNEKVTLQDGKKYLIEGKPVLLDHLAICHKGVWDKGGEATGVDNSGARADELEVAEVKGTPGRRERSDGGLGRAYLDSVLARCDVSNSAVRGDAGERTVDKTEYDRKLRSGEWEVVWEPDRNGRATIQKNNGKQETIKLRGGERSDAETQSTWEAIYKRGRSERKSRFTASSEADARRWAIRTEQKGETFQSVRPL